MEAQINRSRTQGSQGNAQLNYTTRDVTLVKNAQIAAATKVQNLSSLFQKRQRVYLQQLRGYEIPSSSPGKNAMLAIEDDSHGEHALSEQAQLYSQQTSYHRASQDVEQRTKEIEGIAQSISELADMFKDLGNLILDQGTLLDRIDYNVERMSNDVKGAVEELKIATQHQKRSGKCRIIFLLILLIFAAVLILVFKPRHRPDNQQTNPPSNSKRSIFLDRHMPRSPLTLFGLPVKSHATRSTPVRETLRCARWKTCWKKNCISINKTYFLVYWVIYHCFKYIIDLLPCNHCPLRPRFYHFSDHIVRIFDDIIDLILTLCLPTWILDWCCVAETKNGVPCQI